MSDGVTPEPSEGYLPAAKEDPDARPTPLPVDPDGIADKLISYPHWTCWRFEWKANRGEDGEWSKVPINPETGENARPNDPNATAGSFEAALNYHQRDDTDTDGLGFVLTDSPFSGVDLDDLYDPTSDKWDETGREIIDTLDSYSEFSPGGRGGHMLMIGELPEGGRKNDPVEMYDSGRYFTVTGHRIPDTPASIPDREDGEDRLAVVHREAFPSDYQNDEAEDIDAGASVDPKDIEIELDDDEVLTKAKNAKNGDKFRQLWNGSTAGYESHSEADLALCNLLAFWTGGDRQQIDRLFRDSGLMRGKWDEDCTAAGDTYGEHTIETAISGMSDFYDPDASRPAGGDRDGDDEPANPGVEKPDAFEVQNGGYGTYVEKTDDNGDPYRLWNEWTNFELELNHLIITPDDGVEMSITVHPRAEPAYTVEIEPTALNEPRSFKKEVCTGATTTFDAGGSELAKIKQFVGSQDAPRKIGTNHMGYHRDGDRSVWVTPNGNLGADGWIEDTDLVLVEKGITAERKWRLSPEDGDEPDLDAVVDMLELIPETRDHERLLPLLGWFYAAATRLLILDWEEQFNFASVTGETGSGKTTTISTLWELMGMESEPLNPGTTEASLMTTFASSQSVPMWFDEYKPSDMSAEAVSTFHEKVRMAAKGQLDQRSNVDLSDETYSLRAPAVVSGEERIQGSAEERRGVFTSFRKATTEPGSETAIANAKLTGTSTEDPDDPEKSLYFDGYDFKEHALAWIMWVCDQEPDELETLWKESDEYVRELLGGAGVSGLGELELQGLQTIRYGCELYRRFYAACGGADPESVISDAEINDAINFVIAGAAGGENRKSHLDVLLEVASRAAADGYLEEDTQYTFVRKGESNEELRLHLGNTFDKVKKYAKDHDVSDDLLNNKSDYDERLRNEGETINWFTCRKQQTPPVGSALGIDPEIAEREIDGFGRWMWDSEVEGSQGDEWQRLATNAEGRVNVTFEVTHRETDTPDAIAEKGVVTDESKAMDYIVWASDRANIPTFEEGDCYAVKRAKIGRHDGAPQLVLDSGVRDVIEVEPGYGHIENPDAGRNRTIDSAATAAADGGETEIDMVADRVRQVVEQHGPITAPMIKGALLPEGDDPDAVEDAIETLANTGAIYDPDGDGYEAV